MDKNERNLIEGWLEKASNHLQAARDHLKSFVRYSESVESAQECIELSVKSILFMLGIKYILSHGWNKEELSQIAKQIQDRQLLDKLKDEHLYYCSHLPRLLLLANFWAQFYITAKYGFESSHLASAKDLFEQQEAELAVKNAEECYQAALQLKCRQLLKLMGRPTSGCGRHGLWRRKLVVFTSMTICVK